VSNVTSEFSRYPNLPRRRPILILTIAALAAMVVAFIAFTGFYADLLWFRSVDSVEVWQTQLVTKIVLFIIGGTLMATMLLANIFIAYKRRPIFAPLAIETESLERYRAQVAPFRRAILVGVGVASFFFAGGGIANLWKETLLFQNSEKFGVTDPQFGLDISFFVFRLPFFQALLSFAFSLVTLSLIAAALVHYLYGGIRLQGPGERTTVAARVQLSILLGLFVLLKAVAYWLDRYQLALREDRLITGMTYTDVNAVLPAKAILAGIAIVTAALFFANVVRRSWLLPGAGVALLAVSALLIGGIYPALIQQFRVKPSESNREAPFIERNIQATRAAYGLTDVEIIDYEAKTTATAGQLRGDAETTASIRLIDPNVVSQSFRQLQQIKAYYAFPEILDIDRYTVDDKVRDVVVSVREIDLNGVPNRNWINDHLVYTHGFGFAAAFGNSRDEDGKPQFVEGNIPPTGRLGEFQPRIYFGENTTMYSIVGAPKASENPAEFDYPDDASPNGQRNYTYTGKGGVPMGSLFGRLVFAVRYGEQRIILSNLVNSDSRILFDRTPTERVKKVAPWLTLDGDPYPAVVDGRVQWIIDGYTTSGSYPYSAKTLLSEATADVVTARTAFQAQLEKPISYMRNAVKATVDAYDGTVTLYAWDETDPILKAWQKIFPDLITSKKEISEDLLSHMRYPEDMFRVQREVLSRYHVSDAAAFYSGQDFWRVPKDPSTFGRNSGPQPPYFLTIKMPGQDRAAFSLTTPFVPRGGRENLAAFTSVNAEPGPDYGKIRVLQVPRSFNIPGPAQVASNFEAKPEVAQALSLLRQGGASVILGNLLTLPVGGGLLYVQPVYVQATANTVAYPLLQKVLVNFGEEIGFSDTLQGALDQVFGGDAGTDTDEGPVVGGGGTPGTGGGNGTDQPPTNGSPALRAALADAQRALADARAALARGDFTAYGQAQQRLSDAIERAVRAQR
jgi:uncharacterized protein